jgi:hypothetical protein
LERIIVEEKVQPLAHYVRCISTTKKWHSNAQKLENLEVSLEDIFKENIKMGMIQTIQKITELDGFP